MSCRACYSPVIVSNDYCARCGSQKTAIEYIVPEPIHVRKPSATNNHVMVRLFNKSMECSSANLMAGLKKKENTSASSLVPVPIVKTPVPIATKHVEAHAGSHDAVLAASVAMLRDEVRALREDLKEETRLRYKAETLLVRVVEDLMRLRGGEISEDLLDQKLHVATNYLDRLAQKFKIDYDLLDFGDLIASGGFSDVYFGEYKGHCPPIAVAVKKLRIDVIDPDQYFLDLEKEVELLSEFSHPCILQFIGCCVWPSFYILTELMEFCSQTDRKGGTWDGALRNGELALPWPMKLHVLMQIASAVHYLHHLEPVIVHLDIKPLNILMGQRAEKGWIAKLSDFGLSVKKSNVVKTNAVEKRLGFRAMSAVSRSGVLPTFLPAKREPFGTPLHLAPELVNKLPFNEKADIYSFGMLIWETITRRRLSEECPDKKRDVFTLFIPSLPSDVPTNLANLTTSCWQEQQWMRPSISIVLDTLAELPEDEWQTTTTTTTTTQNTN